MTPSSDEVEEAVGRYLEGMANLPPIAWPDRPFKHDGLYLEFIYSPTATFDPVISGGYPYEIGFFLITAVAPSGSFGKEAKALAKRVKDRFPKALRLTAGSGKVVINAPTTQIRGFQDGSHWRQPVRISYITE